jgi:4-hydroxy-tetrahydrodipicolinate synthase
VSAAEETVIPDGVWPILVTPFDERNAIDERALDELCAFYASVGVAGLLALGTSSEFLTLAPDERLAIVRRAVRACAGRIALVAVGNYGPTLEAQAASMSALYELGVDAVVAATSILPSPDDMGGQLLGLAERTAAALGVYECPIPEHRVLTAAQVGRLAATGRFVFMKDTCRDRDSFASKLAQARDSPFKIFQANLKLLPFSLEAGSAGFCGVVPIVAPELSAQACDMEGRDAAARQEAFERLLRIQELLVSSGYPASAKHILRRRGLHLGDRCRVTPRVPWTAERRAAVDRFLGEKRWWDEGSSAPLPGAVRSI